MKNQDDFNSMEAKINQLEKELEDEKIKKYHYQHLFENSPNMIYVIDALGNFININQAGVKLMGFHSAEEIIGKKIQDLFFMNHKDFQAYKTIMQNKGVITGLDTFVKQKNSTILSVNMTGAMRSTDSGKLTGYEGFVTDITEKKKVDRALRHKGDLLQTLLDNIPDTIYFKDQDGHFTMINQAQAEMLGLDDPRDALGKTDFDYFTKNHAQCAYKDEQEIFKTGNPVIGKIEKIKRAEGEILWLSVTKVPIYDKHKVITGIVGISRNITERYLAEEALRESKALFKSLVECIPQNVFSKDMDERFTFANKRYCVTEGKSLEEIIGKTDFDLHPPELAVKYRKDDRQVIETEETIDIIEVHQPIDGEQSYVQVIKTPIYNVKGQTSGMLGMFWDVTERMTIEKEREKLISKLKKALDEINTLKGIVPICANCKKIRDDKGYWNQLELYIEKHSDAAFSHSICPDCSEELYGDEDWYTDFNEKKEE